MQLDGTRTLPLMTRPGRNSQTDGVRTVVRKMALLAVGGALTLVGVILLVVPGPGIPLVIAGLAVLSPEFPWARRQRDRLLHTGRSLIKLGRSEATGSSPDQGAT